MNTLNSIHANWDTHIGLWAFVSYVHIIMVTIHLIACYTSGIFSDPIIYGYYIALLGSLSLRLRARAIVRNVGIRFYIQLLLLAFVLYTVALISTSTFIPPRSGTVYVVTFFISAIVPFLVQFIVYTKLFMSLFDAIGNEHSVWAKDKES